MKKINNFHFNYIESNFKVIWVKLLKVYLKLNKRVLNFSYFKKMPKKTTISAEIPSFIVITDRWRTRSLKTKYYQAIRS